MLIKGLNRYYAWINGWTACDTVGVCRLTVLVRCLDSTPSERVPKWAMTRNLMFSFLHNLTTSKKQQQLQASNNSKQIDDSTLFGVSKSSKSANKSKPKCDNPKEDGILCKSSNALNGKTKKKSTYKTKFFLRKSRWVLWEANDKRFSDIESFNHLN